MARGCLLQETYVVAEEAGEAIDLDSEVVVEVGQLRSKS